MIFHNFVSYCALDESSLSRESVNYSVIFKTVFGADDTSFERCLWALPG